MNTITLHTGDVRDVMATLPSSSIHGIITSPPFLALRSYLPADHPDKAREIGSEPTPAAFIDTMLGLTGEWRRLLAPWASLCVEIGDTYSGSGGAGGDYNTDGLRDGQQKFDGSAARLRNVGSREHRPEREGTTADGGARVVPLNGGPGWPLAKSLTGIPTLYTWSLAYGRNLLTGQPSPAGQWRIRNLLTWTRPNPPVGALGDKVRPATSFVTVACTSDRRWFDLDGVRSVNNPDRMDERSMHNAKSHTASSDNLASAKGNGDWCPAGAPPLDWWDETDAPDWQPLHNMATAPYKGAHYATYPLALPSRLLICTVPAWVCSVCGEPRRRIVRADHDVDEQRQRRAHGLINGKQVHDRADGGASTSFLTTQNTTLGWTDCHHDNHRPGVVLDPFAGSSTTAIAAALHQRDAILIDLDRRNADLTRRRIREHLRIVDETVDGDVIRWTVEAALPDQGGQSEGQLSIFDVPATSPLIAATAAL